MLYKSTSYLMKLIVIRTFNLITMLLDLIIFVKKNCFIYCFNLLLINDQLRNYLRIIFKSLIID